jgi:hypothetical protein
MEIKIIKDHISLDEVMKMAEEQYGDMIKAVVDVKKEIMALGGEFHSDANELLIEKENSNQEDVWGFNILPKESKEARLEFVSLINIRPTSNNLDMEIKNQEIKDKITKIVDRLIV